MSIFRRMSVNTFFTVIASFVIVLYAVPPTRTKWLEFGLLCLFFAFLLMVLLAQHRLTTAHNPNAPPQEKPR